MDLRFSHPASPNTQPFQHGKQTRKKIQKCSLLYAPWRKISCRKLSSLIAAQTDMLCPRLFATIILTRSPHLALPYFRLRCRLNPLSSTHIISLLSGGASSRDMCAYCLPADTTPGQFLDVGTGRVNLTVYPSFVNAFDIITLQTEILCSRANLSTSACNVRSSRESIQLPGATRASDLIFVWLWEEHC